MPDHPIIADHPKRLRGAWVLLAGVLSCCGTAQAQPASPPLHLHQSREHYSLIGHLDVLVDTTGALSIHDVSAPARAAWFAPAPEGVAGVPGKNVAYWARFQVTTAADADPFWLLEVLSDEATVYVQGADGVWMAQRTGFLVPEATRRVEHGLLPALRLELTPGRTQTVYARLRNDFSRYVTAGQHLELWLRPARTAEAAYRALRYGQGLFGGLMLAMFLYNLFLFFSIRDRSFLYYVLFIFTFAVFWAGYYGYLPELFWRPNWHTHPALFFYLIPTGFSFYLLFTQRFLQTRLTTPRMHAMLQVLLLSHAVPVVLGLTGAWVPAQNAMALLAVAGVAGTLFASVSALRRGYRPARFFLLACILFITGILVYTSAWFGLLPVTSLTTYSPQIGAALEAVILSFGLADRINTLRREKQLAVDQARRAEALTRALHETNELKTELLGIAAHDLRSPLTSILGFAHMLREEVEPDGHMAEPLRIIEDASGNMLRLIENLLNTVAIESGRIELNRQPVDTGSMAEGVVRAYRMRAAMKGQQLSLVVDTDHDLVTEADEACLREAMDNLVSNAVKYAPRHTAIHVRVECVDAHVRFSVRDQGPGLTESDRQKLFRPFQRLSAQPTGNEASTGLGLSITKRLVELHDGRIWVESEAGRGSTFGFDLAARRAPSRAPAMVHAA